MRNNQEKVFQIAGCSKSVLLLLGVVLGYQLLGCGIEAVMHGSLYAGLQDFRLGLPGMVLQVFGGYFVIKSLAS